ncbi:HAMP domain-containing histidine kinase [Pigmentiphaga aceris]|uniref:histidine kinase n=1 Tax=Pigmentiphaga aceris TaxID=1940612 RepID=A0A5C0B3D6_9BURK|nr:HAMP domain-containing histidine kinase [Pigmentiphaga aceris]
MVKKKNGSLRQRVIWALTGAVALFVALLAVLAYQVLDQQEDELADALVLLETQRLMTRIEQGELTVPQPAPVELSRGLQAWVVASSDALPPALRSLQPGPHEVHPDGLVWHVVIAPVAGGTLAVAFDATANEERVYTFGAALLALWALCTLAGYGVSRALARVVVGPMHEVAVRIASWAPGEPGIDIDRDDETGRLVEAFNRVQDRVDRSIAREREFAANLSHEVRTPLTAIRTDAELLLLDTSRSAADQARLHRIMRTVDDIVQTIASTHAISGAMSGTQESVNLANCLDDACDGLHERAQATGLSIVNRVDPQAQWTLDRYALLTVARNLIRNACDHAAPATLCIDLLPDGLRFSDDGPGIAADDLPWVFDRFYRGRLSDTPSGKSSDTPSAAPAQTDPMQTRGLGLAIVKRVCDVQGWALAVTSDTSDTRARETVFTLRFQTELSG